MSLMSPKILEYEDGRFRITTNAMLISELKQLVDKYGEDGAEAYLAYVHLMTALDSPFVNLPEDEKEESIIFEINQTIGSFDPFEPLLKPAVEKLEGLYETDTMRYFKSLKISIKKMGDYIRDEEITSGKDGNLSEIIRIHKESGSTLKSFKDIERQVDDELQVQLRGNAEIGEY